MWTTVGKKDRKRRRERERVRARGKTSACLSTRHRRARSTGQTRYKNAAGETNCETSDDRVVEEKFKRPPCRDNLRSRGRYAESPSANFPDLKVQHESISLQRTASRRGRAIGRIRIPRTDALVYKVARSISVIGKFPNATHSILMMFMPNYPRCEREGEREKLALNCPSDLLFRRVV